MATFKRIQQPFQYGLYGDETEYCAQGDGIFAYWCLLSHTRPCNETHRNEVEQRLNDCYSKFWRRDISWDVVIKEIRADITEAKTLGFRIKWMSTGRKIINALVKDTRMCFDTRAFKRGGPDPQDSILCLEQLTGIIEAGVVDETHGATDRKRAYHLEMQNSPSVAYHADAYWSGVHQRGVGLLGKAGIHV